MSQAPDKYSWNYRDVETSRNALFVVVVVVVIDVVLVVTDVVVVVFVVASFRCSYSISLPFYCSFVKLKMK